MNLEPNDTPRRRGDPLAAMYLLAALLLGAGAVVVVVLMFFPPNRPTGTAAPGAAPPATEPLIARREVEPPGVTELGPGRYLVSLHAFNWAFEPAQISLPAGAEVTFRMRSVEDYHGIAITGTPILLSLEQSRVTEVEHTFEQPGEYRFVCSEYCGAGHAGMGGVIVVE